MSLQIFIGVTDNKWFQYLKSIKPDEVNFWQPNSGRNFKALKPGELFLFKLHSPNNYIVGGGIFVRQAFLPVSLAWEAFGIKNGTSNYDDFVDTIYQYRKIDRRTEPDPIIGSLILASPFFFEEAYWIPVPQSWSSNIVQGKTYDTEIADGRQLFDAVQNKIALSMPISEGLNRYGEPQIITPRLGQGGFRIIVTEAYNRRCAITGEKTLPVLDASHIKPYSKEGPHAASNGILLRQDIHTLFDIGYITINDDNIIEVSRKIKEDYGNGKEYYAFHGKPLTNMPYRAEERPSREYLLWHNENIFVG